MSTFRFQVEDKSLTKSQQQIINYIYTNQENIPFLSISELADHLEISVATLSRFVRHAGYTNFKDLKKALLDSKESSPAHKLTTTLSGKQITTYDFLDHEINLLLKTKEHLEDAQIQKAISLIKEGNHIYILAKGASKCLAELLQFRLRRFKKAVTILPSSGSELLEGLHAMKEHEVVVVFGFKDMSLEAKITLEHAAKIHCKTILFTDYLFEKQEFSPTATLYVYRGDFNEYHSMTAPIAVIDNLTVQYAASHQESGIDGLKSLYQLKENYKNILPR